MQAPRPGKREPQSVRHQAGDHDNARRFFGMSGVPSPKTPLNKMETQRASDYPTASTTTSTTTIDEPPQTPEGATRVKRKPWERRRLTGRVSVNSCPRACSCEHRIHPEEHESDSEEPSHVPDIPTATMSSKQHHRRNVEIDEGIARMTVPDPCGSSTRSPVAADDDRCDGAINNEHALGNRPVETPSPAEDEPGSFQIADLFGPSTTLVSKGRQIGRSSPLLFFKEKPKLLAAATETRWEKVTLTVDSGASDTVVPPTVAPGAPLQKSDRVGIEYEIANGHVIENLGEKHCLTKFSEANSAPMLMNFQVVDVSKALLSVH